MPSAPAWTWASSTPASWPCTKRFRSDLLERVEDVLLNRRPDATERLVEFAETVKKQAGDDGEADVAWRSEPVEERLEPRAGQRHRRFHRGGRRRSPRQIPDVRWRSSKAR